MHNLRRTLPRLARGTRQFSTPADAGASLAAPQLDYASLARDAKLHAHNAALRNVDLPPDTASRLTDFYARFRDLTSRANTKRHEQRELGEQVKKAQDPARRQSAIRAATELKPEVQRLTAEVSQIEDELRSLALLLPNTSHPSSPRGAEENAITVSMHGPERLPADPARDHVTISNSLDLLDLPAGATVSGSAWYFLKNEAAQLELALINYALSIAMKHGYTPTTTPDVVRSDIARRAGFRPRDAGTPIEASQIYSVETPRGAPELVLAGTAEIPLAGMHARQTYEPGALPRKMAGLGRAFRAEAGAGGADTRGLYRVHQFAKLELFVVCDAAESEQMLEEIRAVQIEIFEGLGFPFRVLDMPTEELGAAAYRKYDIEAWMPGRGKWGEISSASNCTDYQARRLLIRHAPAALGGRTTFAHTLNGTAAAVPRLIVALLENGARFNAEGKSIGLDLPSVLRPFWVSNPSRDVVHWV
ncbi:seryl-tRNA synthetase [Peniophora sp. CONT]|nr:seryl-tRNA synthetase [Peniophora sp. CONT]